MSHYDVIYPARTVKKGAAPRELKRASGKAPVDVDAFLAANRNTGLLIMQGDTILAERYQYERTAQHRFASATLIIWLFCQHFDAFLPLAGSAQRPAQRRLRFLIVRRQIDGLLGDPQGSRGVAKPAGRGCQKLSNKVLARMLRELGFGALDKFLNHLFGDGHMGSAPSQRRAGIILEKKHFLNDRFPMMSHTLPAVRALDR